MDGMIENLNQRFKLKKILTLWKKLTSPESTTGRELDPAFRGSLTLSQQAKVKIACSGHLIPYPVGFACPGLCTWKNVFAIEKELNYD